MDATSVGTKEIKHSQVPNLLQKKRLQGLSLWVKHGPLSKLTALDTQYHTLDFVDEFHLTLSNFTPTIPFFKPW